MCGYNDYVIEYKGCKATPKHVIPQTDWPINERCGDDLRETKSCPNLHPSPHERWGKTRRPGPCPTCEGVKK